MISISREQITERWDTLPDDLREALVSEANSDFIWRTCEDEHMPDDKIHWVAMAASRVLMGFIHPEDLAREIEDSAGIDQKTALSVEGALGRRIFAPLSQQLTAIYAPLSKFATGPKILNDVIATSTPSSAGPKIISENFVAIPRAGNMPMPKPATPPAAPQPQAKATQDVISQTASGLKVSGAPLASNWSNPAQAPQPTKKPDTGWSRQTQQDPVVKLGVITPSIPTPTAPPAAPSPSQPSMPPRNQTSPGQPSKAISEFDRLAPAQKPAPQPSQPAPKPAPAPMPPPVMLHQSEATPAVQAGNFQVATGMQNQISNGLNPKPSAPRPAVLEFGGAPQQVPTPPKPPTPAPTKKVIIKDFLGPEK